MKRLTQEQRNNRIVREVNAAFANARITVQTVRDFQMNREQYGASPSHRVESMIARLLGRYQ